MSSSPFLATHVYIAPSRLRLRVLFRLTQPLPASLQPGLEDAANGAVDH
jgi:hypothetical protein